MLGEGEGVVGVIMWEKLRMVKFEITSYISILMLVHITGVNLVSLSLKIYVGFSIQ